MLSSPNCVSPSLLLPAHRPLRSQVGFSLCALCRAAADFYCISVNPRKTVGHKDTRDTVPHTHFVDSVMTPFVDSVTHFVDSVTHFVDSATHLLIL